MIKRDPTIHVRVPPSLKEALEHCAKTSGRSLNSEVVQRLESTIPHWEDGKGSHWQGVDLGKLSLEENLILGLLREAPPKARTSILEMLRALILEANRKE